MKKLAVVALILVPVLAAAAWFEPTATVRGWARGEPFFANRSASYWRGKLASEDPVDQAQVPQQLRDPAAVQVLANLLSAPEPAVRWQAADLLGKIGPEARNVRPQLVATLKDADPHVRSVVARVLGETPFEKEPVPGEIDGLRAMLTSPEKLPAIRTLAKCQAAAAPAVADLIHLLTDTDPTIRWNAAWALGKIGPAAKDADPDLVRALKDPDALVREHAAEALGDHGPAAAPVVPDLVAVLADSNARVRRDAVRSLGQIGPAAKSALPTIEKLLSDPEAIVREAAKTAKRRIAPDAPTP